MLVYSKKQAQIEAQIRALLFNKASIEVLAKYSDYNDVFSVEYAVELSKNTGMNEYTIKLEKDK